MKFHDAVPERGAGRVSLTNGAARWGYLLAIVAAPLLFGGNIPLAWGVNAALLGAVLLLFSLDRLVSGRPFPVPSSWIAAPLFGFTLVAAWIFLQSVDWTPSSWHNPAWARAAVALGEPVAGSISINPWETRLGLLRLATAGAAVWLGIQIGREPRWARRILAAAAVSAALCATYGLLLQASGSTAALWIEKRFFADVLTGTFINPNHFAILMSLAFLASVGLLLRRVRGGLAESGFSGARGAAAAALSVVRAVGFHAILIFPICSALAVSGSRAGLVLTILGLVTLLALESARSRASTAPLIVGACAIVAGGFLLASPQADRLGAEIAVSNAGDVKSRLAVGEIVVSAVRDAPILGFGYGAFADVFPSYRGAAVPLFDVWLEAHNSYLEAILGLGVPAAALLFLAIGVCVARCFVGALRRRRDHTAPMVAASASVVIALHALVDFSVQLQGITLVYCALLGAGCAQSWPSGRGKERRARGEHARPSAGARAT